MKFRYTLPKGLIAKVAYFSEFANGATQVSVRLNDGRFFQKVLISNCSFIIAMRGYKELPFAVSEIEDIYQTEEDVSPKERGGWDFWDDWKI